ncbi:unnamed protein product [Arabis nemorensis]|uniref:Uncharacterized protein n=1 Tax=Arabis nemorensis TaxID=586526 RepID=A0A565ATW7_9BRAS|nr:unnamed protein product [Arabis nemorensis]
MEMTYDDDKRFSSLSTIMRLVNEIAPFARYLLNKKTQFGKRLTDIEETKLVRLKIDQEASREVRINKRRRVK